MQKAQMDEALLERLGTYWVTPPAHIHPPHHYC